MEELSSSGILPQSLIYSNGDLVRENEQEFGSSNPQHLSSCAQNINTPDAGCLLLDSVTLSKSNSKIKVSGALKSRFLKKGQSWITRKSQRAAITASSSSPSHQRGIRTRIGHRIRRHHGKDDLTALALPLGMSIAAVIVQILDKKDAAGEKISADRLSMICISAVEESIANLFGDRFEPFMRNFETSFISTLKTLRLIMESSVGERGSDVTSNCSEEPSTSSSHELPMRGSYHSPNHSEVIQENTRLDAIPHQLILHGEINQQLALASQTSNLSGANQSVLSTFEKSVMEQSRSNDLKILELTLNMQRLNVKQSQLDVSSDANLLERFKLSMGISKASFKVGKFKTQLQETRDAEVLKKCIDCLVAGLLIMSASLLYGAYIYSYKQLTEATTSCMPSPKESKSWWVVSNPMASVTSSINVLRCYIIVLSRMLFGILMILALSYSLLQRSGTSRQTMPITFILLLLGVACGFAGKLCVDSLGGSGFCWLLYWEVLCSLHFFASAFTSVVSRILLGPISVSVETFQGKVHITYLIRRVVFYSVALFFLPVLCGLMPFASLGDWKEHFSLLAFKLWEDQVQGGRN